MSARRAAVHAHYRFIVHSPAFIATFNPNYSISGSSLSRSYVSYLDPIMLSGTAPQRSERPATDADFRSRLLIQDRVWSGIRVKHRPFVQSLPVNSMSQDLIGK